MYLLKPACPLQILLRGLYSHSTMYLLKPFKMTTYPNQHLNSHSTMYLLKLVMLLLIFLWQIEFTFHHVSIKTKYYAIDIARSDLFTFHHVSIKTQNFCDLFGFKIYSHSTMYLLKHVTAQTAVTELNDSHSTMYLLKPYPPISGHSFSQNSHSTMYLLKLLWFSMSSIIPVEFTFHHVSIKTRTQYHSWVFRINSHSTMYLLKPEHWAYIHYCR